MGFAAALAAFLLFATLATQVANGQSVAFDQSVREAVRAGGSPVITALMRFLAVIGEPLALFALSLAASLVFYRSGWQRGATLLLVTVAGSICIGAALKLAFQRARPEAFFHDVASGYSFPSGHALVSTAVLGGMAMLAAERIQEPRARAALWTAAITAIAAIGFSRIYLGVHYPSDVIAGHAMAAVWVWFVFQAERQMRRRYSRR